MKAIEIRDLSKSFHGMYAVDHLTGENAKAEMANAVPELENLIAMSRIFGVTIGALLGVEPTAEVPGQGEPAPPEEHGDAGGPEDTTPSLAGELTERELAAAEFADEIKEMLR